MPKLRGRLQKFIMPDDCQNPRNDATFCFGFLPPAPVFQTSGFGLLGHGKKFRTAPTIPRLPRPLTFLKCRMPVFPRKRVNSNFNLIKLQQIVSLSQRTVIRRFFAYPKSEKQSCKGNFDCPDSLGNPCFCCKKVL